MLLSHYRWLCSILPVLITATPQKTAPARSKRSLPPKLRQDVPACAQPCLRTSLSEQFPFACTTPVDLGCLCSRYSFSGQSLGELALGCIYASCSTFPSPASAYNVCLGEENAVPPTLTALTVVARTSSTSTSMTSSRPVTITTHTSSTTHVTSRTQITQTDTVVVDSVSFIPSPTSSSIHNSTIPLAATEGSRTMTPAQIAGLAVAAGAAFIIAIGLMAMSIFLRRRRENKNSDGTNEKGHSTPKSGVSSSHYSRPCNHDSTASDLSSNYLLPPPPTKQKAGPNRPQRSHNIFGRNAGLKEMGSGTTAREDIPTIQVESASSTDLNTIHPLLRPSQETFSSSSRAAIPLEQIGVAISVAQPAPSNKTNIPSESLEPEDLKQRPTIARRNADLSQRPDSAMTQTTLFEEDEIRRESKLLPALPVAIPPIRAFKPSRAPAETGFSQPAIARSNSRQALPQPELFLDIPVRYSKQRLPVVAAADALPRSKAAPTSAPTTQSTPNNRKSEHNPLSADSEFSHGGDIPDYYFTAYQEPRPIPIHTVTSSNAGRRFRPKHDVNPGTTKPKRSTSTISRATSRASSNIRDSISSQTSFETVDENDPTPEDDDDDKRLSVPDLSPVAESPLSNLRYPKVPRTANQLVPRSPKSPQSLSQSSPRFRAQAQPSPSALLLKRLGDQSAGFHLTTPPPSTTTHPRSSSPTRPPRYQAQAPPPHQANRPPHLRSSSATVSSYAPSTHFASSSTYSPLPSSQPRSARPQSSQWPRSPALHFSSDEVLDADFVRPLTIRKTLQTPVAGTFAEAGSGLNIHDGALKSPAWVPRLTPTRQGDDLFINVSYSKEGRR